MEAIAKGKYQKWLEPDGLLLLEAWARDGLTDEQIAEKMGISRKTLSEWKNKYGDIGDTLKRSKEIVDIEVENTLLELAKQGNITAIIFWLKNRKPKAWRDKPIEESENNGKLEDIIRGLVEDEE